MGRASAAVLFSAWITATALYVQAAPCNFQWQVPERQYINEGGQFTVDCSFTAGFQTPSLYTISFTNPLNKGLTFTVQNNNVSASLTVDDWNRPHTFTKPATVQLSAATTADAGNYSCKIQIIIGCDPTIIPGKQFVMVLRVPPSKPVITRYQSTGFTVREGDSPKLKCMSATGTPPLTYTWSRGSTSLTGTPDSANTFSILTIPSVQRSQQGPYQCSVQNAAGSNTADGVKLDVHSKPVISESSLAVDIKGTVATVVWSHPKGHFTSYGIKYCVKGTTQCEIHNITNLTTTSADITLPDDGRHYEFYLIVYQGDDAVVTSLPVKQIHALTTQDSFPVGLVVGVLATVVVVAVTGAFLFIYLRRRGQQHNGSNRNNEKNRGNAASESSAFQGSKV